MNSIGIAAEAKSLPFNADEWVVDIVCTKVGKAKWEATTICASVVEVRLDKIIACRFYKRDIFGKFLNSNILIFATYKSNCY